MTAPETARFGQWGERMAAVYLRDKGYEILARNFRTVRGELDIVAARDGTIVFVEVKSRRSERFGRPADAVTEEKERHLRAAARSFLRQHRLYGRKIRFDVLEILDRYGQIHIRHLQGWFR